MNAKYIGINLNLKPLKRYFLTGNSQKKKKKMLMAEKVKFNVVEMRLFFVKYLLIQ